MFGVSFPELLVLGTVALLVLGPEKLPGMLRTVGNWVAKLRRLTTEVRHQSGIDDVLRAEGFDGGLNEFRSLMRGGVAGAMAQRDVTHRSPAVPEQFVADKSREYPDEGPDAYGALPEDLVPGATPPATALPADPTAPVVPPPVDPTAPVVPPPAATSAEADGAEPKP